MAGNNTPINLNAHTHLQGGWYYTTNEVMRVIPNPTKNLLPGGLYSNGGPTSHELNPHGYRGIGQDQVVINERNKELVKELSMGGLTKHENSTKPVATGKIHRTI